MIRGSASCLLYSLRVGPHPHALSLGGALRALHSVASLGPQALPLGAGVGRVIQIDIVLERVAAGRTFQPAAVG